MAGMEERRRRGDKDLIRPGGEEGEKGVSAQFESRAWCHLHVVLAYYKPRTYSYNAPATNT